jgi:ATP-dependent helicase/nuclease subunit A
MAAAMANRASRFPHLKGAQLAASDPRDLIWLSASAGTGKTQVLTARVLRLLLSGVQPETILCLTFTKAGAAEMADRIHRQLASWVRTRGTDLAGELRALGEKFDPDAIANARTLFARVLDAPGGGLRIQTIHSFCQTLLAGFPAEAGLTPGFRPLDARGEAALARTTLARLLADAETGGDLGLIRDVQALSRRLGEGKAEAYLQRCAREVEAMESLGSREGIEPRVRLALDVPLGDVEALIEETCGDDRFDLASLRFVHTANAAWKSGRGQERARVMEEWLAATPKERAAGLAALHRVWAKQDGTINLGKGWVPPDPDYAIHAERLHTRCDELLAMRARAELAALISAGLRAGQSYARAYAEAKRSQGVVDFDDLIRTTVRLLDAPGMGDWVRYKLDQATDHILVDEAQDTNLSQWTIVASLAGEFFAGEGARGGRHRTIFTVGDFKQAIFGFQGTDPRAFEQARIAFERRAAEVDRDFQRLSLDRSFRSSPAVLAIVDKLIETLGPDAFGQQGPITAHLAARAALPGTVTLWKPLSTLLDREPGDDEDQGEEGWIDDATRAYASRLARQIRSWIDERLWVAGKGRPIRPEDVLILVRKRGDLASLIVARLHAEGVAVAGVDRLRLNAPLAVRDLLSAIRFVLQPEDDLNLACLLVSPLFGWSQEKLYEVGFGRTGSLYAALRQKQQTPEALLSILGQADFSTPYRFLEAILSGPMEGRRKLVGRLGEEARDPIEELLNGALTFEGDATPSLQRFLDWFDRGDVEITRDPSAPADAVRVMTVHGSKGLQAPIVILADATVDPDNARTETIRWPLQADEAGIPIFRPRAAEMTRALSEAVAGVEAREREEHWRLLYVALTRAEERLVIGGALGTRAKGEPPPHSWYASVRQAMLGLGVEPEADPIWHEAHHYRGEEGAGPPIRKTTRAATPVIASEPAWLRKPAPKEARPPRPLAPSAVGLDLVPDPPPNPAMRFAAERGRLLHALFERLPAVPPDRQRDAADKWLLHSAGVSDAAERAEIVDLVCAILADPDHAEIFGADTLAEAPIAAVVGGEVIAGTVDRLLVGPDRVRVVDFKTGRRVPREPEDVPEHHLKQMAAYVAAIEVVFPGRRIDAALLYTSGPRLIPLAQALIDHHKPNFAA